jgi:hypothetical protein
MTASEIPTGSHFRAPISDGQEWRIMENATDAVEVVPVIGELERAQIVAHLRTLTARAESLGQSWVNAPWGETRLTLAQQTTEAQREFDRFELLTESEQWAELNPVESRDSAEIARLNSENATLRLMVGTLQNEQVKADDPRLSDFWELAHRFANNAGYCEVFDRIADELGGPRRQKTYTVRHSATVSMTVEFETEQTVSDPDDLETDFDSDAFDTALRDAVRAGNFSIEEDTIEGYSEKD